MNHCIFYVCIYIYRIAGNFHGVQFSRIASLQSFRGLIFADACHHAHYTLYNRTYFAGLIFVDSRLSAKNAKIGPLENFPLYGKTASCLSCVWGSLRLAQARPESVVNVSELILVQWHVREGGGALRMLNHPSGPVFKASRVINSRLYDV